MILIKPVEVTSNKVISSIPEPDPSVGEIEWTPGTYNLGDRRVNISTDREYEVVADPSTSDDPVVGVLADPPTWVDIGPINKFKMFDEANNTSSVGTDLTVEISPDELVNSVACFNVSCDNITVTAFDADDNQVFSQSITMRIRSLVNGWYNYYFTPFVSADKFVILNIPPTTLGKIKIEFFGTNASVGTCVVGQSVQLGDAQYGTSAQLLDFTNPIEDEFGNITYSQGFTATLVDYDVLADTGSLDAIFLQLKQLGKMPAVFVGNPVNVGDSTLVYGYVRDYNQTYTTPVKSKIKLTVRGLV